MMTVKRDATVYLRDVLSAIDRIEAYTAAGKRDFFTDGKTQDAVIRQFSIIGEAAARLPRALKTKYRTVPWKKVVGMRNIIIHDYSETDIPTIWDTVRKGLPVLRKTVERMLEEQGR